MDFLRRIVAAALHAGRAAPYRVATPHIQRLNEGEVPMLIWQKFRHWLAQAKAGEEFAYHNGLLAYDRERDRAVEGVAEDAFSAAQQGLVQLFQLRLPYTSRISGQEMEGGCLYIARRTAAPIPGRAL